jgi:segregation and condensation protein B
MSEPVETLEASTEAEGLEEVTADHGLPLSAVLESLLLAHAQPALPERLMEVMRCTEEIFDEAVAALKARLQSPESGLELATVAGKLQLRTKSAFAPFVREILAVRPRRLSSAALETLAVIAYQQPIVKSEIERIRGVDVSPTLKTLLERNLVKIVGYQATAGQPALYTTTEEFLHIFGISALSELPSLRDIREVARDPGEGDNAGEIEEISAESENEPETAPVSVVSNTDMVASA